MYNNESNQVYSYIEKRMIDDNSNSIKFDPNRHRKNYSSGSISNSVKIISFMMILSVLIITFYPFDGNSSKNIESFLKNTSSIVHTSNDIMSTIVTEYNNNNFSSDYKKVLQSKLDLLNSYNLDSYKNSKYSSLKIINKQILESTKNSINLILNTNVTDQYTSGAINTNLSSIRSNYDLYRTTLIEFFKDNNILYTINGDDTISYQL